MRQLLLENFNADIIVSEFFIIISKDPSVSFILIIITFVLWGIPALDSATYNCP